MQTEVGEKQRIGSEYMGVNGVKNTVGHIKKYVICSENVVGTIKGNEMDYSNHTKIQLSLKYRYQS